ncbi:MAG: chromosomal replication initiator protein DnaA [Deltaproteobacteria bacterium]|nr:chromosomal replication initiator protein DnaA [Deltaproteobacteria bacterium]
MSKKKDIWDKISADLRSKLPSSEFEIWFRPLAVEKLDPDLVILRAPNKFVGNWIIEKYLTEIKKAFSRITKHSPSIYLTYEGSSRTGVAFPQGTSTGDYPIQRLNPSLTFESFVAGKCNEFAYSSALSIAKDRLNPYNPFYIYSSPGLGKTHLLNAIGNYRAATDPHCLVKYVSADTFTSDLTYAIRSDSVNEFRAEYGTLDLFLFDDMHLLEFREKSQEEFLVIFDKLHKNQKQIVITATEPPQNLKNIDRRLKSRVSGGLISELLVPDTGMRIEILKRRLQEDHINMADDVLFFLANYSSDIKTLVKNLIKITNYASVSDSNVSISVVKSLVQDRYKTEIDIPDIKGVIATYFDVPIRNLTSTNRKRVYTYPRQIGIYISRKYTSLSLKQIGRAFGYKDHSTAHYALKKIETLRKKGQKEVINDLKRIENLLL